MVNLNPHLIKQREPERAKWGAIGGHRGTKQSSIVKLHQAPLLWLNHSYCFMLHQLTAMLNSQNLILCLKFMNKDKEEDKDKFLEKAATQRKLKEFLILNGARSGSLIILTEFRICTPFYAKQGKTSSGSWLSRRLLLAVTSCGVLLSI